MPSFCRCLWLASRGVRQQLKTGEPLSRGNPPPQPKQMRPARGRLDGAMQKGGVEASARAGVPTTGSRKYDALPRPTLLLSFCLACPWTGPGLASCSA